MIAAAAWLGRFALQLGALIFLFYALILFSVPYSPLLGIPLWLVGQWLITLLHEAGHALAARACGWRVIVFAVRPFAIRLPDRDIVFLGRRWYTRQSGWVLSVPARPAVATRGRFAIIVAAGPVVCLLLAVPLLAATTAPGRGAGLIACGFGVLALRSCLFSLLPSTHAGGTSDGQSLWRLWRDESWTTLRPALWLKAMLDYNIRLRDLPRWMIDAVPEPAPVEEWRVRYVATMEIGIVLDSMPVDVARARKLIDAYRVRFGATEWLDSVDSYCAAIWEAEGEKAQATLWTGQRSEEMRPMVLAAEAAVAARRGDGATARMRLDAMRGAVKAESPFHNATFDDIGRQIEGLLT
jgi:hypothetical protein